MSSGTGTGTRAGLGAISVHVGFASAADISDGSVVRGWKQQEQQPSSPSHPRGEASAHASSERSASNRGPAATWPAKKPVSANRRTSLRIGLNASRTLAGGQIGPDL